MRLKTHEELLSQIQQVEKEHKTLATSELTMHLQEFLNKLKLLDANMIAKDIIFARQRSFDYHDKPGK